VRPPAPYAPAKPPLPRYPHPEPREFHQMLRTWNYAWWKPVLGIALVIVGMVVVAPLVLMPVLIVGVMLEGGDFWANLEKAATLEAVGPASLLYLNLTLGSAILVTWAVMRWVHRMRPRWLTSVVPKMRWKLLFILIGVSIVALVAQLLMGMLVESVTGQRNVPPTGEMNELTATTALLALIVLLTTPFQAAGEEYVFRGYLMQAVGSLSRSKWVALLVTATLFAVAHGVQNFPLFFDRFMFGLIVGWLVIRTGGLEAGIAMHILNNFLAFGFALLFSDLSSSLNVREVGWENIPVTLTQAVTYAALTLLVARRMNLQRRTAPPMGGRSSEGTDRQPAPSPSL
jgi:membrane protease YdiL (CAAX protease family)